MKQWNNKKHEQALKESRQKKNFKKNHCQKCLCCVFWKNNECEINHKNNAENECNSYTVTPL